MPTNFLCSIALLGLGYFLFGFIAELGQHHPQVFCNDDPAAVTIMSVVLKGFVALWRLLFSFGKFSLKKICSFQGFSGWTCASATGHFIFPAYMRCW